MGIICEVVLCIPSLGVKYIKLLCLCLMGVDALALLHMTEYVETCIAVFRHYLVSRFYRRLAYSTLVCGSPLFAALESE